MKISIIHPSRSRPEMAVNTLKKWINNCDNKSNIEYHLSLDTSDPSKYDYCSVVQKLVDDGYFNNVLGLIHLHDNKSAIEAINTAALGYQCKGDLLVIISDDFDCFPGWDTALLEALDGKSDFIVKTQDGIQKTLITLPIMDRVYYNRFGYIYHPSYKHMHSDEEMTIVGFMLGKTINLPLTFKHNHYSVGAMKKDVVNENNDASYPQGFANLKARKKINFGLKPEEIVNDYRKIVWH